MHHQVDETEEIGVQTNVKLKAQTEQMKAINDDVNTVQAHTQAHTQRTQAYPCKHMCKHIHT